MAFINSLSMPLNSSSSTFVTSTTTACPASTTISTTSASTRRNRVGVSVPVTTTTTPVMSADAPASAKKRTGSTIRGRVFVVGDNIDTDQIIPAEYLTLVPSNPDEYIKLGSYAMNGLPADQYTTRYVGEDTVRTEFPIILAGHNFGCGSSREHAPVAIGAAGGCAVVARSYARIFFRNCSATGELYPWELDDVADGGASAEVANVWEGKFSTGDTATIDFERCVVTNERNGVEMPLKSLGDVLPVVDAGGIFEFARQSGMIAKK